jgi:hypothetical protein
LNYVSGTWLLGKRDIAIVLTRMILANLVLEIEAVRLAAILTLSHHAVLVFAASSPEGVYALDSLLLF